MRARLHYRANPHERLPMNNEAIIPGYQVSSLRSQIVTLKRGDPRKYRPFALTEHGALMAASILNSSHAVAMSI